jgi:hypothetical protein
LKESILEQSFTLSEEILKNIELSEIPLTNIALKTSRLARLLNDFEHQKIFQYEASGYPTKPDGVPPNIFELNQKAQRTYFEKNKNDELIEYAKLESIEQYESELASAQDSLHMTADANISITSSNPNQYVHAPSGNTVERRNLRNIISKRSQLISSRKSFIYDYVLEKNYELKYSKFNSDIFSRTQLKVDTVMSELLPDTIKKFTSAYDNLLSENNEDWSNAVHSCRRILQDLADQIYPSTKDKVLKNGKSIKLGEENYINRLIAYIDNHSSSKRFEEIVGSNLKYIGERLDSIFNAAQKGSHKVISTQDEADRYVIYTYLLVGDILKLKIDTEKKIQKTI